MDRGVPGGRNVEPAGGMQFGTERRPFNREYSERIDQPGCVLGLRPTGLDASSPSSGRDLRGCTGGATSPTSVTTAIGSWRQNPSPPGPGATQGPSLDVCLDEFSTAVEAQWVLDQISAQLGKPVGPSYAPPSSVPSRIAVPGVPGAVASSLDLSTSGQESIYFAKGRYIAYVVTLCSAGGGTACGAWLTAARRQYGATPG